MWRRVECIPSHMQLRQLGCGESGATTLVQLQLQRLGQWQINGGAMALWRRSVSAPWSWEVAAGSTSPGGAASRGIPIVSVLQMPPGGTSMYVRHTYAYVIRV